MALTTVKQRLSPAEVMLVRLVETNVSRIQQDAEKAMQQARSPLASIGTSHGLPDGTPFTFEATEDGNGLVLVVQGEGRELSLASKATPKKEVVQHPLTSAETSTETGEERYYVFRDGKKIEVQSRDEMENYHKHIGVPVGAA